MPARALATDEDERSERSPTVDDAVADGSVRFAIPWSEPMVLAGGSHGYGLPNAIAQPSRATAHHTPLLG